MQSSDTARTAARGITAGLGIWPQPTDPQRRDRQFAAAHAAAQALR